MKRLLSKFLLALAIVFSASFTINFTLSSSDVLAFSGRMGNDCYLLGFTSWDCNVDISNEATLKEGIWTIAANIATDITVVAAYLVLGYVIYGGYKYIFSSGDPGKVAEGKKTLTQAFIGLAIVLGAHIILNSIRIALSADFSGTGCKDGGCAENMVLSLIQWVVAVVGIVAAIFVVYGGILYITSSGDPNKTGKAKQTILYAIIGLVIVALAEIITAFVSNIIRESISLESNNNTIISKEINENQIN